MSITTANATAPVTPAAPRPVVKKPAARQAAAAPSKAVTTKTSAPAKAAPKAPAVKAPSLKVAIQAAVKKSAIAKPVKAAAPPATSRPATKNSAPAKAAKKPRLVRDSFTIPKAEYVVLDELKQRAARLALPVKKSELLRAGIKALAALSDTAFQAALKGVPAIKTGRPASDT